MAWGKQVCCDFHQFGIQFFFDSGDYPNLTSSISAGLIYCCHPLPVTFTLVAEPRARCRTAWRAGSRERNFRSDWKWGTVLVIHWHLDFDSGRYLETVFLTMPDGTTVPIPEEGGGAPLNSLPWHAIPKFTPGVTNVQGIFTEAAILGINVA